MYVYIYEGDVAESLGDPIFYSEILHLIRI